MAYKMYAAFIASLSVALTLASNETFGGPGVGQERNVNGEQSISGDIHYRYTYEPLWDAAHQYPSVISVAGQERNVPALGPAAGGFFYGPGSGEQSISGDIHYRYTYEPLWDAAHQYPSVISPSETVGSPSEPVARAFVPGCRVQTVTVPDSKEQTVNIVRC
jgi:hypothetical protein